KCRGPFYDHCFSGILGGDDATLIAGEIAPLARLGSRAEVECALLPESPNHHGVWGTVGLGGGDPVVMRLLQTLLGPSPGEQAFLGFRDAVAGHVGAGGGGGFRLYGWHWEMIDGDGNACQPSPRC